MERSVYVEKIKKLKSDLEIAFAVYLDRNKSAIDKYDSFSDPVAIDVRNFINKIENEIQNKSKEESNFDKKAKKFTRFIDKLIDFDFSDNEDDDESAEQNGFINNIKGYIERLYDRPVLPEYVSALPRTHNAGPYVPPLTEYERQRLENEKEYLRRKAENEERYLKQKLENEERRHNKKKNDE